MAASTSSTTQLFLDVFDITNDMLILSDGAVSVVITVSAMNFGLLSENEQDATIYAYAALLNSLSFAIQIVVRSQPKDVTAYLRHIQDQEANTQNPLYRQKIREYRSFVESLVQEQHVLDKKFYIVIPLSALEMGLSTASLIPSKQTKKITSAEKNFIIEKATTNLHPRRDHLIDQLARIGLYSRQLSTQELIQMLYSSYNPESFEGLKVTDTSHYTTPLVQAKIQGAQPMVDTTTTPMPTTPGVDQPITTPVEPPTMTPPAAVPPMPTTSETPFTPTMPAPTQFSETPIVTPPVAPAMGMGTQPTATPAADPQELINQTLSQLGSQPTPATPSMGMPTVTPPASTTMPGTMPSVTVPTPSPVTPVSNPTMDN